MSKAIKKENQTIAMATKYYQPSSRESATVSELKPQNSTTATLFVCVGRVKVAFESEADRKRTDALELRDPAEETPEEGGLRSAAF